MRPIGIYGVHALNLIPIHECAFNYLFISRFMLNHKIIQIRFLLHGEQLCHNSVLAEFKIILKDRVKHYLCIFQARSDLSAPEQHLVLKYKNQQHKRQSE